jgi:diaminohydroxyphosphoribosylaminopyrimidine deaminase / 5-amino-6-(5-phosphoribosylamino)uracil reductase
MVIDTHFFMGLALDEAWKYQGLTYPNPAVGACIVGADDALLAVGAHQRAGEAHAEVLALRDAYVKLTHDTTILSLHSSHEIHEYLRANHNNCFYNCSIYTTLEPCSHVGKTPSCAILIKTLGLRRVIIGSKDTNKIASCGATMLRDANIEVLEGVMQEECAELLYPFVKHLEDRFVFFKWAQRLSGSVDAGIISSKSSREHLHALRDRCDLLVIGGNTVRTDRPTLDARLVDGKAPDVLIYSREKEFDRSIPLFGVEGREVFIEDDLERLQKYKHIMIEGGAQMFALTQEITDRYLCYVAPSLGGDKGMDGLDAQFEILNIQKESQDIMMWMKRK